MSEEDMILWQDVLDLVMAGRVSNLMCPFCKTGALKLTRNERKTKLQCENGNCRKYIEGAFLDQLE